MPPSPTSSWTLGDSTPSPTVSVVIPTLNEEHNLPLVLEGLPPVDEVVVVDGGSIDDTIAVAREVRPDVVVVRQTRTGKGNALACGFAACTGDIVVTLNADGSTDPGELPRYVDALLAGAEVAHGSRYREGGGNLAEGRWDRTGHRMMNALVNVLFGTRFTDLGYGYNAYWRILLPALGLPAPELPGAPRGFRVWGDGPEIEPLINIRMAAQGLRVVEIASVGYPRIYGRRQRRVAAECLRALRTILAEYLRRWRIVHESARPAGVHSARRSGPAPGRRTARQYAALQRARPRSAGSGGPQVIAPVGVPAAATPPRPAAELPPAPQPAAQPPAAQPPAAQPPAAQPPAAQPPAAQRPAGGSAAARHGAPSQRRTAWAAKGAVPTGRHAADRVPGSSAPEARSPLERRQGGRRQRAIDRSRSDSRRAEISLDPSADWLPQPPTEQHTGRRAGWSDLVQPAGDRPAGTAGDRPDLTVITGEGGTGPTGRRARAPMRSAHLRAVSGERYHRGDDPR